MVIQEFLLAVITLLGVHDLTHDGTSSVATYQWRKDGTLLTKSGPLLTLSFLRLSDAGQYTCEVTVGSKSYCGKNDITLQSKEL